MKFLFNYIFVPPIELNNSFRCFQIVSSAFNFAASGIDFNQINVSFIKSIHESAKVNDDFPTFVINFPTINVDFGKVNDSFSEINSNYIKINLKN